MEFDDEQSSLKGKLEFWDVSARMSLKEQEHFR